MNDRKIDDAEIGKTSRPAQRLIQACLPSIGLQWNCARPKTWIARMAWRIARREVPGILESKHPQVNEGLPRNDIAPQHGQCDTCRSHCNT
ncbi:hypothetical protein [Thauera sp. Sel9]|uniref:hypothetical protein n=1 Tax=Thauera sp. Sel9 TaxID=2974299 RepID=UPI0021E141CF|nr:hypothetical protein [Thauera sp. Sel9]MCV2216931.1 hypothetical protein [Thauera sp. Sel9]